MIISRNRCGAASSHCSTPGCSMTTIPKHILMAQCATEIWIVIFQRNNCFICMSGPRTHDQRMTSRASTPNHSAAQSPPPPYGISLWYRQLLGIFWQLQKKTHLLPIIPTSESIHIQNEYASPDKAALSDWSKADGMAWIVYGILLGTLVSLLWPCVK